jgi:hypothetical protein
LYIDLFVLGIFFFVGEGYLSMMGEEIGWNFMKLVVDLWRYWVGGDLEMDDGWWSVFC